MERKKRKEKRNLNVFFNHRKEFVSLKGVEKCALLIDSVAGEGVADARD